MQKIQCILHILAVLPMLVGGSPAYGQTSSAALAQIQSLREQWTKFLHAKQLDSEMALYAEDAVFLQPTGERITGKPAIRDLFKQVMAQVTSAPTLTSVRTEAVDDLAYDSGEYRETLTSVATGERSEERGSYLMVLKKGADGAWRIVEQMWSEVPHTSAPH